MVLDAPPLENTPARVLIIDTAWLGDVVFTTSLIGSASALWPQAELHVLTAPRGEPILRGHPQISHLWVMDKRGLHKGLGGLWKIARQLKKIHFELVINAHPSARSRLLTALTQAPERIGYTGLGAKWCFTRTVAGDLAVEPDHVRRRTALLRALGQDVPAAPLWVPVPPEEEAGAAAFLRERGLSGQNLLGLVVGSAWETKRWPVDKYGELAREWVRERGGAVLVFGGPAERNLIAKLERDDAARMVPVVNEPLPRVAALLKQCRLVVGNDTGVGLLAMAVQGPRVVLLYGSTQINYAFPPPHFALNAGVPCCLPRTGHGAHACRWSGTADAWCMEQLTVERVLDAIGTMNEER